MTEEWKLVTQEQMTLTEYPCGVSAGDIISLKSELEYKDDYERPIGKVRPKGEQAMVLTGNPNEADVVWLRWRDGERQTWDNKVLQFFDKIQCGK